ncbi:hypothetical protein XNW1_2970006 [Xenorhabdus nematophila str. Websteri]|nr:hypothetical protein XNW1_2970006 [Xenorhabdus nematophila str. Websteri]
MIKSSVLSLKENIIFSINQWVEYTIQTSYIEHQHTLKIWFFMFKWYLHIC